MADLRMEIQTSPGGSYSTVDLAALGVSNVKLSVSYTAPARLDFTAAAPEHTYPLGLLNFIRFWDADGAGQSNTAPLFEGFVEEVQPGGSSNRVSMVALDPTVAVSRRFKVQSHPYQAGTPPTLHASSRPRAVFNVPILKDDDYAFAILNGQTVGGIAEQIFEDMLPALRYMNAAPAAADAFETSDLAAMDLVPQEKEVFDTVGPRQAMEQLIRTMPSWRMLWYPGTRKWRFGNIAASTQVTFTLNSRSATHTVLSLDLRRSLEGRATAVKVFGPPQGVETVARTDNATLEDISDGPLLETYGGGLQVWGKNKWRIADANARRVMRQLPAEKQIQVDQWSFINTENFVLRGYFPATRSRPVAHWRMIPNWWYEQDTGIISLLGDTYALEYEPNPYSGQPKRNSPTIVEFTYAVQDVPLSVRYPETGFAGTAYDVLNYQVELSKYEEMLAVGFRPIVTTSARLAAYAKYAEYMWKMRSDIVYTGSIVLDGLQWEFAKLDRRINIAAVDEDGATLTTGWESINAYLTDVEYDIDNQTTTLTLSSDHLEMIGLDEEQLKKRLKIKALEQRQLPVFAYLKTTIRNRRISDGFGFSSQWRVHETEMIVGGGQTVYVDPLTGEVG